MASKKDFLADEWAQLQHGLAGTVLLVSARSVAEAAKGTSAAESAEIEKIRSALA